MIGVSIIGGDIVWINEPYKSGGWPDIKNFRDQILHYLEAGEHIDVDSGYQGEDPEHAKAPHSFINNREGANLQSKVRPWHETAKKHLNQWGCLDQFSAITRKSVQLSFNSYSDH